MAKAAFDECDERGCESKEIFPQFTKRAKDVRKGDAERQPRFYCAEHGAKHPNVSFITGQSIRKEVRWRRSA